MESLFEDREEKYCKKPSGEAGAQTDAERGRDFDK